MSRTQKATQESLNLTDMVFSLAIIATISYFIFLFMMTLDSFFMDLALIAGITKGLSPSLLENIHILSFIASSLIAYYIVNEKLK
ncbi:hypothetical protein [Pseudomonas sp. HY7a-MNA-CIBAN-0227]|uniref:hypothetical protein n=1 Tax=Pseudomonas sp. HY7a-MNA-CIBAN-0227 TaxID=3140474 RepID=UPI0033337317